MDKELFPVVLKITVKTLLYVQSALEVAYQTVHHVFFVETRSWSPVLIVPEQVNNVTMVEATPVK